MVIWVRLQQKIEKLYGGEGLKQIHVIAWTCLKQAGIG